MSNEYTAVIKRDGEGWQKTVIPEALLIGNPDF